METPHSISNEQVEAFWNAVSGRLPEIAEENNVAGLQSVHETLPADDFNDYLDSLIPPIYSAEASHLIGALTVRLSKVIDETAITVSVETEEQIGSTTVTELFEVVKTNSSEVPRHMLRASNPRAHAANESSTELLIESGQSLVRSSLEEAASGLYVFTSDNFALVMALLSQCTDETATEG